MSTIKSYSISSGNSAVGTVGFVARVFARSPEEAVTVAQRLLPDVLTEDVDPTLVEYFNIYVNAENLTVEEDVDSEETMDIPKNLDKAEIVRRLDLL